MKKNIIVLLSLLTSQAVIPASIVKDHTNLYSLNNMNSVRNLTSEQMHERVNNLKTRLNRKIRELWQIERKINSTKYGYDILSGEELFYREIWYLPSDYIGGYYNGHRIEAQELKIYKSTLKYYPYSLVHLNVSFYYVYTTKSWVSWEQMRDWLREGKTDGYLDDEFPYTEIYFPSNAKYYDVGYLNTKMTVTKPGYWFYYKLHFDYRGQEFESKKYPIGSKTGWVVDDGYRVKGKIRYRTQSDWMDVVEKDKKLLQRNLRALKENLNELEDIERNFLSTKEWLKPNYFYDVEKRINNNLSNA